MTVSGPLQEAVLLRVIEDVDVDEAVALTKQLIRIESVSGHEGEIARFIADYLQSRGLTAQLREASPGRPNVHARLGTGDAPPTVLFTGHLDTVPFGDGWTMDPLCAAEHQGRIYGRGASDMKSGLACMLVALTTVGRIFHKPAVSVSFAGVVDEEVGGLGTRTAIADGLKARYAILAEPTDVQVICAAKGNAYYGVDVCGRAAHAGSPHLGRNAISIAGDVVRAVDSHNALLAERRHPLLGRPYATVTRISGGQGDSAVPSACTLLVDRRLLPVETAAAGLEELGEHIRHELGAANFESCTLKLYMDLPALEAALESPIVGAMLAAAQAVGVPAHEPGGWPASCDGGLLANGAGIHTVLFGPGSIVTQAHRPDESVAIDEIALAARAYAHVAARALLGQLA